MRGLTCHVHLWGPDRGPATVFLHGWADTGLTFQFLIDATSGERRALAPDWRGFGDSDRAPGGYWFPDYLADLDALLERFSPGVPVDLVGHSMGGNVALLYAGTRPERVRRVVSLEGFGLPPVPASEAPQRYRRWLEELRAPPRFRDYPSLEALAERVRRLDPRLPPERARFVAAAWGRVRDDGTVELRADPRHRIVNPVLYRHEEFEACMRAIAAPVLLAVGAESPLRTRFEATREARASCLREHREAVIPHAGHMLHHDAPEAVAMLLAEFLPD